MICTVALHGLFWYVKLNPDLLVIALMQFPLASEQVYICINFVTVLNSICCDWAWMITWNLLLGRALQLVNKPTDSDTTFLLSFILIVIQQKVLMPELYDLTNTYKPEYLYADGPHRPDTYWGSREFLAWLYIMKGGLRNGYMHWGQNCLSQKNNI